MTIAGYSAPEPRVIRWMIGFACLWLPLLLAPLDGEAARSARPCKAEPTDEVINYGDLVACQISPLGDGDTFRFAGAPGERVIVFAVRTGGTLFSPCIELFGPDGIGITTACGNSGVNRIDIALTQAGPHTILMRDEDSNGTGTYNLGLERVFPLTRFGTALAYGQTLTDQAIDLLADLRFFVFTGTTGSRISTQATRTDGTLFSPCIELYGPDGIRITSACGTSGVNRIDASLTQNGTHALLLRDEDSNGTGTYTITLQCIIGSCTDAIPTALAAAVSPPSLAVPVGTPAIASATITNTGSAAADAEGAEGDAAPDPNGPDALSCGIAQLTGVPAQFSYQAQDPATGEPIGSPNTPVNILPGANQNFRVSLTPTAAFCPTDVKFGFSCSNAGFAKVLTGVNTLLLAAGAPSCGLSTSVSVSQSTFAVGETLIAGGSVTNPGLPGTAADFYVGIFRPDNSIQFVTSTGLVVGNAANLGSFRPIAVNVPLSAPFTVSQPTVFTQLRTAGDPGGPYLFFIVAVKTGALAGGTITNDQILSVATAPYSFP